MRDSLIGNTKLVYSLSTDCQGPKQVTSPGTITNGAAYTSNTDCIWFITAPVGQRVSVTFTSFNVGSMSTSGSIIASLWVT